MGNDSVYVIQPIPGKGKGVVATATILKGTRILFESPLFSITRSYKATKKRELQQQIARKVASLPRKQRRAFRSLYNAFEDEDPGDLGIVRTNALPLGHEATESGIFLDGARFNHSCSFNAHDNWNEILQKLTIHAVRDIEEGEEITICYLETIQNRGARQSGLQDIFGFLCLCSLCALPPFKSRESDKRWDEVEKLDNLIGSEEIYYHFPLRGLHSVHRLLNIFRVEGYAGGRIARAYYDAFSMAAAHGDRARARIFARRSASARLILEGDDSPIVKKLEVSAKDPKLHLAFGLTERWKTTVDDIPVGLDGVAFERWLWKREEVGQYADLRKESASFPSFAKLPSDKHIDLEFYASLDGMFHPRRHWCFLAEITDYDDFLQLRLSVKDKAGQEIPVAFQTDERGFDFSPQKNHTVAILYPEQNSFLDSSVGIRVENSAILNIFTFPMCELLALSDRIQQYSVEIIGVRVCHGCDRRATDLKKCARCGFFWYCDKDCQIRSWKEKEHRVDCQRLKDPNLQMLFNTNWDRFDGPFLRFNSGKGVDKGGIFSKTMVPSPA